MVGNLGNSSPKNKKGICDRIFLDENIFHKIAKYYDPTKSLHKSV
jgi:hypothetical protein